MPKIKDPRLIEELIYAVYEIDVEGTKVIAYYNNDPDSDFNGWKYDLTPCFVDLTEDEIQELEEDFDQVLCELR
jgi:hypothetical protein